MEVQFGPNSADEPNLLYKLQRKIKVFNTGNALPNRGYNLVTCSSKYGIVFVASPDGVLSAYNLKELIDKECEPKYHRLKLEVEPTHISINCDQEWLAVIGGQRLYIYKVLDFQGQNVLPSGTLNCDVNPGTYVSALQWNPCIPEAIAIVFFDGTLLVCQVNTMQMKKLQTTARCLCWSPKGKQLVTGNNDGTLCQFKPDLVPMKTVPAPNLFEGAPVEALAIHWISTYQFAVVYKKSSDDRRPAVTIVNTPKSGQSTCYNYEDICYSLSSSRPWYYYLQGIAHWNLILCSSSNSMELATLGSADGASWLPWCQSDEARPELPLTDKKQENYPVGVCVDTCAVHQLPWGENDVLPPMPLLHVVSQTGLLSIFNIINLNKASPQICTPPQPLLLPAAVMTSEIPDDAPPQVTKPPPMYPVVPTQQEPASQPPPATPILQVPQISASSFFSQTSVQSKPFSVTAPQATFGFSTALPSPPALGLIQPDPKQIVTSLQSPVNIEPVQTQQPSQADIDAALKAEKERDELNKAKMNKDLTDMLVKEVNEFQMELYKFTMKTRETESRLQRDIQNISTNHNLLSLDTDKLMKECVLDGLRTAINQLKLELVRACAVVAEARSHSENKDLPEWAQADPLTAKRVDSVRKLAYYVQNQLDQARRAIDLKWSEIQSNDPDNRLGAPMIRPLLDDVYQPLVKQQEILMRQQAVLRTMKNTLEECDAGPVFKSTSILRSTPFKKDLSKLTKNIINMKIEASEKSKDEPVLSSQKLDALRDVLSNHKPMKVKAVNVDLRQQLAAMYKNYKKSLTEKVEPTKREFPIKSEPIPSPGQVKAPPPTPVFKLEPKPDIVKESPKAYAPTFDMKLVKPAVAGVARTLFTEEPKVEQPEPQPNQSVSFTLSMPFSKPEPPSDPAANKCANMKSLIKDLLQKKSQAAANVEAKNDANTFMGQNICSPTPFNFSKPPTAAAPSAIFAPKPGQFTNIFGKFDQSSSQLDTEAQGDSSSHKSAETGEKTAPPSSVQIPDKKSKEDKPMTNLFGLKPSTTQNVPDVLKTNGKAFNFDKLDPAKVTITPVSIEPDSKENVPKKSSDNPESNDDKKESNVKPFSFQFSNKLPTSGPSSQPVLTVDSQKDKTGPKTDTSTSGEKSPISIFGAANASIGSKSTAVSQPSILFGSAANVSKSTVITPLPPASSIFGTSTETKKSETESNNTTVSGSIFTSTATTTSTAETSQGSIVASTTSTQSSTISSSTAQSIFSSATVKPSVFSTPSCSESESTTPESSNENDPPTSLGATNIASSVFASANAAAFGTKTTTSLIKTSIATTTTSSTTKSLFGTSPSTSSSIFGNTSPSAQSVFSAAVSKASFGPEATTTQSIFGTTTTTTQSSVFGSTATTEQKSVFDATSSPSVVFGVSTTPSTQSSVFGTAGQTPTSVFGTTTQASIFGGTTTTQASIFGTPSVTTQASLFGTPTASTQASIFGAPAATPASVFGATSTQSSVFGTASATTQASVFGTPAPSTQTSVFGSPTTQASMFGTPPQATQASVFGTPSTPPQSTSPFGGAEANLFASASISTTTATNQGSGGSIFGGSPNGSVFGSSNSNVFGGKTTFSQSNPTAASIFGGGASFGQKPATDFWGGANNNAQSGFGSSGFGQPATTQAQSIFGGAGGGFSAPAGGAAFGAAQPSAFGAGDAQPSVFGSPQQTAAAAFGGSPVFGSKPVFGQSAGFGSPTSGGGFGSFGGFNKSPGGGFGGSATFGSGTMFGGNAFGNTSPGKAFGGASPTFQSPTQSNATFESLATQNTLTFGNLAQQSGQPQAAPQPTFNASPSFTGWRG